MKILWFSNRLFTDEKIRGTGTWLDSMADILVEKDSAELYNITKGNVKKVTKVDYNKIQQWLLPNVKLKKNGLPPIKLINQIIEIVEYIQPDIIHIWGTESYWGLLTARGYLKANTIVEIQGLTSQIKNIIFGDLKNNEILKSIGIKEILKPSSSIFALKRRFTRNSKFELEIIKSHSYISTQSDWVRSYIGFYNPYAEVIHTKIPLRKQFLLNEKWNIQKCNRYTIFTSLSSIVPYKGLHVLIDAVKLLKSDFPEIKLLIIGQIGRGIRESGYEKFLKKKIKKNKLSENVIWLGSLNADEIVSYLKKSHVSVFPTFIESYGVAVAESLALGVPTIASYSGALPEQGIEGESIFYYPPGDKNICASKIQKLFNNDELAEFLSVNAYKTKSKITNDIFTLQMNIYNQFLNNVDNSRI